MDADNLLKVINHLNISCMRRTIWWILTLFIMPKALSFLLFPLIYPTSFSFFASSSLPFLVQLFITFPLFLILLFLSFSNPGRYSILYLPTYRHAYLPLKHLWGTNLQLIGCSWSWQWRLIRWKSRHEGFFCLYAGMSKRDCFKFSVIFLFNNKTVS